MIKINVYFYMMYFLLLMSCTSDVKEARKDRPNIIFIMADDHAKNTISCYGSTLLNTPNIERLSFQRVRFNNSFVTYFNCAPSQAVFLIGRYSHVNGLRDNRDEFNGNQVTFPKLLQSAGYSTVIIGKWHLKTKPTGFDYWNILNILTVDIV